MDNFENIIEEYTKELLRFSECSCAENEEAEELHDSFPAAGINTENVMQSDLPSSDENDSDEPYSEEVKKYDTYDDFLKANTGAGTLRIQVFGANQAFPIPNARVKVKLLLKDSERGMFDGLTDINGIAEDIILPAPDIAYSQSPDFNGTVPYSSYTLTVEKSGFVRAVFVNLPVFSGIKSIQGVELVPLTYDGIQPEQTVVFESETLQGGLN